MLSKRSVAALVLLTLIASVAFVSESAAHDAPVRCGSDPGMGAGWFKLRAHGVWCRKARAVANEWERICVAGARRCPSDRSYRIDVAPGFRCRHWQSGYETVFVKCAASGGSKIVHFYWGS